MALNLPFDFFEKFMKIEELPVDKVPALEILNANLRIENVDAASYLEILTANPEIEKCQFLFKCCFVQLKEIQSLERQMEREKKKFQDVVGASAAEKYGCDYPGYMDTLELIEAQKRKINNLLVSVISLPKNIVAARDFREYKFVVSSPDQVKAAAYLRERKVWVLNRVCCLSSDERFVKPECRIAGVKLDIIGGAEDV